MKTISIDKKNLNGDDLIGRVLYVRLMTVTGPRGAVKKYNVETDIDDGWSGRSYSDGSVYYSYGYIHGPYRIVERYTRETATTIEPAVKLEKIS